LEDSLSTRTYGILAGIIGSAIGAWWWLRHRGQDGEGASQRGTVIYNNRPTATDLSEGIV
jgi:hypothetical protein